MKLKYVIIGREHQFGRRMVLVEGISEPDLSIGRKTRRQRVIVRDLASGERMRLLASDLGPAHCPIEHKLLAKELSQPHYVAALPDEACIARKKAAALDRYGRWAPSRDEWARHWTHEFAFAEPMFDQRGRRRRAFEFEHEFELRFAQRMEQLQMRWSLEPDVFDIPGGGFRPDFYLPEHDLYVELTESGVEHKAHKLAGMAERHPGVRVAVICGAGFEPAMHLDANELIAWLGAIAVDQAHVYAPAAA